MTLPFVKKWKTQRRPTHLIKGEWLNLGRKRAKTLGYKCSSTVEPRARNGNPFLGRK